MWLSTCTVQSSDFTTFHIILIFTLEHSCVPYTCTHTHIDIFRDQRLVIAVTHFDHYYTSQLEHGKINAKGIKQAVCSSIKQAVGETFPEDRVIPISGLWAWAAHQYRLHPHNEKMRRRAMRYLQYYDDEDERVQPESLEAIKPLFIASKLQKASGIDVLEQRYASRDTVTILLQSICKLL